MSLTQAKIDYLNRLSQGLSTAQDPINHPAHYTSGTVECIDAIHSALGHDGFVAFLRGQVIKYNWRMGLKDAAAQDAGKAAWYADKLKQVLENAK